MNGDKKGIDNELSILGSDQVTKEQILSNLEQVQQEPNIVKIEIEDLLICPDHHSLLPDLKALFTCDNREWKRIRFFDNIDDHGKHKGGDADLFAKWQSIKTKVMRDCEDTLPTHLLEFLTIETHVVIDDASPFDDKGGVLMPLLKKIPQDEDVIGLRFGGALEGVDPADIPDELDHYLEEVAIDPDIEKIAIELVCGWQDEEAEEDTEWIDLCKACRDVLKKHKNRPPPQRNNNDSNGDADLALPPPPALSRNVSAPVRGVTSREAPSGRETPVRMPSRRMQRGVSRDEVEQQQSPSMMHRSNTDPLLDDDQEGAGGADMDGSAGVKGGAAPPRLPSRGGRLSRQAPDRTKSLGMLPSRTASAADRLALLGASGSRRVGSRRVPDGRSLPERTASGRRTPTRTSSRKVPEADGGGGLQRSLPQRTNSRRGPPSRSSSRKVSRQEEEEIANEILREEGEN